MYVGDNSWQPPNDTTLKVASKAFGEKDLVATNPSRRNWPGILISLLVIGAISSLIITCIILLTPANLGPRVTGHLVTLDDVVQNTYKVPSFSGEWINDELVFRDDDGGVSAYSARTQQIRTLVRYRTLRRTNTDDFLVSPDLKFVLLFKRRNKNTGGDGGTKYWIWGVDTGYTTALRAGDDSDQLALQYAVWVPAAGTGAGSGAGTAGGTTGGAGGSDRPSSALLIARQNNLVYRPRADRSEWYAITSDGRPGRLYHGVADPLYRDHILDSEAAAWPSPGGGAILYFSLDNTAVPVSPYTVYGTGNQEPTAVHTTPYPIAGGVNPVLTVMVVNVSRPRQMQSRRVQPPGQLADQEAYAAGVHWLDDSRVTITWYNRRQNSSLVSVCSAPRWQCRTIHQSIVEGGWLEIGPAPVVCADDPLFLVLTGAPGDSSRRHITQVNITSRRTTQVTSGEENVNKILACGGGYIYYLAVVAAQRGQRHLFRVSADHPDIAHCVTCSQVIGPHPPHSHPCLHHDALFSADGRHYALFCNGPAVPYVTVSSAGASKVPLLRNNSALRAAAENTSLPTVRTLCQKLASGMEAQVRLLIPPQYREGDLESYPLLLRIGSDPRRSPGADGVAWAVDWTSYLASRQRTVVADVTLPDQPAGTWSIDEETASLRSVVEGLSSQLDFVNPVAVTVIGHGYGGQLALRLLAQEEPAVKCAIALAPITAWFSYASAFSERHLGLLPDSRLRYLGAGFDQWAGGLANKRFLLVHGSADSKVGVQQTFLLARWLQKTGTPFVQTIYPDEGHGLDGVVEHLYQSLDQFQYDCHLPRDVHHLLESE